MRVVKEIENLEMFPTKPAVQFGDQAQVKFARTGPSVMEWDPGLGNLLTEFSRFTKCNNLYIEPLSIELVHFSRSGWFCQYARPESLIPVTPQASRYCEWGTTYP